MEVFFDREWISADRSYTHWFWVCPSCGHKKPFDKTTKQVRYCVNCEVHRKFQLKSQIKKEIE